MNEFKEYFGKEIILQKASYNQNGQCHELEYCCGHPLLDDFRQYLKTWLNDHEFSLRFFMVAQSILVFTHEKLSQAQINEFEMEFEVVCSNYSKECSSTYFKYEFESL